MFENLVLTSGRVRAALCPCLRAGRARGNPLRGHGLPTHRRRRWETCFGWDRRTWEQISFDLIISWYIMILEVTVHFKVHSFLNLEVETSRNEHLPVAIHPVWCLPRDDTYYRHGTSKLELYGLVYIYICYFIYLQNISSFLSCFCWSIVCSFFPSFFFFSFCMTDVVNAYTYPPCTRRVMSDRLDFWRKTRTSSF